MQRQRILIIEDDRRLVEVIGCELRRQYEVASALTASEGLFLAETQRFDLVILDLNLPDMDGLEVAEQLRGNEAEILMLTARSDVQSRVSGLYAGASDYLAKPFDMAELVARVHARLRRGASEVLSCGHVELRPDDGSCAVSGDPVALTAQEFRLLTLLMANQGKVFSREAIEDRLYPGEALNSNIVEALVSKVRRKLSDAGATDLIRTVRGMGYVVR